MNLRSTIPPPIDRAAALVLALAVTQAVGYADTRIVSEVTVTGPARPGLGTEGPAGPLQVTTCYRDGRARVEDSAGRVTIYDPKADKVYRLDAARKTYFAASLKETLRGSMGPTDGQAQGMPGGRPRMKMQAEVKSKAHPETRSIAGQEARRIAVTAKVKLAPEGGMPPGGGPGGGPGRMPGGMPGGGRPGGGRRGGGGRPGGGMPGGGPGEMPAMQVEGEYWLSEAVAVSGVSPKEKGALLPSFAQTLPDHPMAAVLWKPLAERMAREKGFPLASRVTLASRQLRRPGAQEEPQAQPEPTVVTMEVRSVTEETLDDALFRVPEDYAREEPPARRPGPDRERRRQ